MVTCAKPVSASWIAVVVVVYVVRLGSVGVKDYKFRSTGVDSRSYGVGWGKKDGNNPYWDAFIESTLQFARSSFPHVAHAMLVIASIPIGSTLSAQASSLVHVLSPGNRNRNRDCQHRISAPLVSAGEVRKANAESTTDCFRDFGAE